MAKSLFFYALGVILLAASALGDEEMLILTVDEPVETGELSLLGLQCLSHLEGAYLVQGDERAAGRLARTGASFSEITRAYPGEEVYLLRPRSFKDEMQFSEVLLRVGPGTYLTTVETHRIDE